MLTVCVCERGQGGESLSQVTPSSLLSNTLAFSLSDLAVSFVTVGNMASYGKFRFIKFNLPSCLMSLIRKNIL